jgi:hypothetical protein
MPSSVDYSSWEFAQKVIRIGHNRDVKAWFRDITSDSSTNDGRSTIKTAMLIRDSDSGITALSKMMYFQMYIREFDGVNAVASGSEARQVKVEAKRAQLVVIFKPSNQSDGKGHYPLYIPHYGGDKTPTRGRI